MNKLGKLLRILAKPSLRRVLFKNNVAAGVEHIPVISQVSFNTIVDIGANRGQFALAARYCFPKANIFCFEPLAGPAKVFSQVFLDDSRVELFEVAIGPENINSIIHLSGRDDSSSLLPITQAQDALFPGTAEKGTTTINVDRLSQHVSAQDIERPALLKLDVQGYELQALRGCDDLLHMFEWVYVECSFIELYAGQAMADEVISWLREYGLKLRAVHNMAYDADGVAIQADFLFSR